MLFMEIIPFYIEIQAKPINRNFVVTNMRVVHIVTISQTAVNLIGYASINRARERSASQAMQLMADLERRCHVRTSERLANKMDY